MNGLKTATTIAVFSIACSAGVPLLSAQAPATAPGEPPAQAARPAVPRSPDIHPDRTVTFRLMAPKASEVTLNGSWDGETNIKMTKDDNGVWSTTVCPLTPQLWAYWYAVDGVKV